jgi:hypothetical protein
VLLWLTNPYDRAETPTSPVFWAPFSSIPGNFPLQRFSRIEIYPKAD